MPIMPAAGVEFIPGYQLVERLGFGGYGEVWKVTAPGGIFKAIKIIYGDLTGPRAEQELKSLERIKTVRHPFLLSLERFEIVQGQLLIVTELADRSLMNRYKECLEEGLSGVPRDELLAYLGDAADALDYMNETHGLQHLDIKPDNLLLLSGRIKVADFGLVKDLVGSSTHITGGVTPIYAPPEAFDGRVSRFSDQYSLAIVYQEMLTGHRPFPGTTPYQLAAQHCSARPMLDALPPHDRETVGRSLAKLPEQRFPSCRELVVRLQAAGSGQMPVSPTPPRRQTPLPFPSPAARGALGEPTDASPPPPAPEPAVADDSQGVRTLLTRGRISAVEFDAKARPVLPANPDGYRPVLFLGVGGLAARTLRQLRGRFHRETGSLQRLPIFRMLLIDTDRAPLRHAQQGPPGEALPPEEILLCPLFPTEHYRAQSTQLLNWLDRRWLYGIPRSLQTEGLRPLARLALVDHAPLVLSALREAITSIVSQEARTTAVGFTGRALRSEWPHVVIVAAIGGGTGGGMVLDLGYAVRQVLADLGLPSADVTGMLVQLNGQTPDEKARARVNGYATLRELWHWAGWSSAFPGAPEHGLKGFTPGQAPFDDCYLFVQSEDPAQGDLDALVDRLAGYLHFDATLGGGYLDRLRTASSKGPEKMALRSGGLAMLRFPRARIVELAGEVLCRRVVESWAGQIPTADRGRVEQQARDSIVAQATVEVLRDHFIQRLPALLGLQMEELYERLAGRPATDDTVAAGSPESQQLLVKIEGHLGSGIEQDVGAAELAPLEATFLQEATRLADGVATRLIDRLLDNVETPGLRLRAAEAALGVMTGGVRTEDEQVRQQLADMRTQRLSFRQRLAGESDATSRKGSRFFNFSLGSLWKSRSKDGRLLWAYFCLRLEEMIEEGVYTAVLEIISRLTRWGLELTQARRKLAEFVTGIPVSTLDVPAPAVKSDSDQLFPFGAQNMGAAVAALLEQLPPELSGQLDRLFQSEVLDSCGGLWTMLTGSTDGQHPVQRLSRSPASAAYWNMVSSEKTPIRDLREELMKRARLLVGNCLQEVNLTGLILEHNSKLERLWRTIEERLATAQRTSLPAGLWKHVLFVLPNDSGSAQLRTAIEETLGEVPLSIVETGSDLIVNWETAGLSLPEVASKLAGNDSQVAHLAEQLQTRRDVSWTRL
jgi:hypothetical protein